MGGSGGEEQGFDAIGVGAEERLHFLWHPTSHCPEVSLPHPTCPLQLPPRQVEVNMHPTKREVGFLHQVCVWGERSTRGVGGGPGSP